MKAATKPYNAILAPSKPKACHDCGRKSAPVYLTLEMLGGKLVELQQAERAVHLANEALDKAEERAYAARAERYEAEARFKCAREALDAEELEQKLLQGNAA